MGPELALQSEFEFRFAVVIAFDFEIDVAFDFHPPLIQHFGLQAHE